MGAPNAVVNYSAKLIAGTGITAGVCLIEVGDSSFGVATSANRTLYGRADGIAITSTTVGGACILVTCGRVPASITGLAAGSASWAIVNSAGAVERKTTPVISDDVCGWVEVNGDLHAAFGFLIAPSAGTTPGGSPAQVQYNAAGALGGITGFTSDGTTVTHTSDPKWSKSSHVGTLAWTPTTTRTVTIPDATDTLVGKATTDVFTNKTFSVDATGNVLTSASAASGDILYHNGTKYVPLAAGHDGSSLVIASGIPTWGAPIRASVAISALAIDWQLGDVFTKALSSGSSTFTFSNATDGQTIVVVLTGSSSTVTWPTVKWAGGTPPTQTTSGTDVYTFVKAGSTIYGSVVQAMS